MKKFLILMLSLALAVCALTGAIAEEQTEETNWYEVTDESVLTVRLPVNGGEWAYEISDPDALELITEETTENDPATFVASFKGTFEKAGDVSVKFTYTAEGASETRELALFVNEANLLQVVSETVTSEAVDWCEISEDETALTVRIPENTTTGYSWTCAIDNAELLKVDSEESVPGKAEDGMVGVPGEYVLTLSSPMSAAGTASVVLTYARSDGNPAETRTLTVFVNEAGLLTLTEATVNTVVYKAE